MFTYLLSLEQWDCFGGRPTAELIDRFLIIIIIIIIIIDNSCKTLFS